MLFRFSKVEPLSNSEWDFDNAKYIGSIDHKDYTEYTKLLHFMKEQDVPFRAFGNLSLVKEDGEGNGQLEEGEKELPYTIADINLRVPLDNINLECMEVYVCPSY